MIEKSHRLPKLEPLLCHIYDWSDCQGFESASYVALHGFSLKTCAYLLIDGQDSNKSKSDRKRRQRGQKRFGSWLQKQ